MQQRSYTTANMCCPNRKKGVIMPDSYSSKFSQIRRKWKLFGSEVLQKQCSAENTNQLELNHVYFWNTATHTLLVETSRAFFFDRTSSCMPPSCLAFETKCHRSFECSGILSWSPSARRLSMSLGVSSCSALPPSLCFAKAY